MELKEEQLYKTAYSLSLFTIFYNLVEGVVSMLLGYADETLTLFGFGVDSFIEVMSGIGIAVMIMRIRQNPKSSKSGFILSDANCTKVCVYMSVVLLVSSLIYQFTGFIYADVIGAAGLIYFSVAEGKEAFDKAKGKECSCDHCETKK